MQTSKTTFSGERADEQVPCPYQACQTNPSLLDAIPIRALYGCEESSNNLYIILSCFSMCLNGDKWLAKIPLFVLVESN